MSDAPSARRAGAAHVSRRSRDRDRSAASALPAPQPSLVVGLVLLVAAAVRRRSAASSVDTERRAAAVGAGRSGRPRWQHPFGTDRQGRDLLAVMVAGTPLTLRIGFIAGFIGVGIGDDPGLRRRLLRRHGRRRHPRHRRHRPDRAGLLVLIIIAVSIRGGPDRRPDGAGRRLAGLALPDAHDPRPGADAARARLRPGGAALRHERAGDHRHGDDAEPAAVPGRHAWSARSRRRSWPRSAWRCSGSARSTRRPSA